LAAVGERQIISITPNGGWHNVNVRDDGALAQRGIPYCPCCQSPEWKAASLVYREGISVTKGRFRGSGLGIGRTGMLHGSNSIAGGVFRGRTSGMSQTILSQMAAPPRRRRGLEVLLAILAALFGMEPISQFAAGNVNQNSLPSALIALGLLAICVKVHKNQKQTHEEAVEDYENTRMCERCGTFYRVYW